MSSLFVFLATHVITRGTELALGVKFCVNPSSRYTAMETNAGQRKWRKKKVEIFVVGVIPLQCPTAATWTPFPRWSSRRSSWATCALCWRCSDPSWDVLPPAVLRWVKPLGLCLRIQPSLVARLRFLESQPPDERRLYRQASWASVCSVCNCAIPAGRKWQGNALVVSCRVVFASLPVVFASLYVVLASLLVVLLSRPVVLLSLLVVFHSRPVVLLSLLVVFHSLLVVFHSRPVVLLSRPVVLLSLLVVFHSRPVVLLSLLVVFHSLLVVFHSLPVVLLSRPVVLLSRPVVFHSLPVVFSLAPRGF